MDQDSSDFDGAALELELRARPTPLVRIGGAWMKLESLRPSGGADDRALALYDEALPRAAWGGRVAASAAQGAALAAAGWARARGCDLWLALHGKVTHEAWETLKLWGATCVRAASREEAKRRVEVWGREGATLLPALDAEAAVEAVQATLGRELLAELEVAGQRPATLVAPAGARAALLGAYGPLRARWPETVCIAVCAESQVEEFPELPPLELARRLYRFHPGVVLRPLPTADVRDSRAALARRFGIAASHAAAAAAAWAQRLGEQQRGPGGEEGAPSSGLAVALCTALGEREFSLDRLPPTPEDPALSEGDLAA